MAFDCQAIKGLLTYLLTYMSAQCYDHRFGYCTNAKTCFIVHIGAILAERRVLLLGSMSYSLHGVYLLHFSSVLCAVYETVNFQNK